MFTTEQVLPASQTQPEKISILLVSPEEKDRLALRRILNHNDWGIEHVREVRAAAQHIRHSTPSLIVTERALPDGNWRDVLACTESVTARPLLLVISRHADENLWAEVLNLGGYDVLLKPFDPAEVTRVVGMAWRHWRGISAGAGRLCSLTCVPS